MAESAPQIQYRQELVMEFEEGMSWLRRCTVNEAVIKGNQATFLVAGSGGADAVTRGLNGMIPARADSLTQVTATLKEWHDLVRKSRFNIFQSQGNQKRLMQQTTRKVLNRRIDKDIIEQLDTANNNLGAATTFSLSIAAEAATTLGENEVPTEDEDNMWAVATHAVRGYLMQISEFNSADYVEVKPLNGPLLRVKRWAGFN
ncbi:MAG: phage capsid protein, partial [bacterium]